MFIFLWSSQRQISHVSMKIMSLNPMYLCLIWNKSWQQHPTRRQLYGHLPPITKNIQARRTRYAGHSWRSKDEIVSDVLLWTPAYGQSKAGRPARTSIQQLCDDTGCNPEDLPEAMNDRETWRKRVWDIRASCTTWWWWSLSLLGTISWSSYQLEIKRAAWSSGFSQHVRSLPSAERKMFRPSQPRR